MDVCLIISSFVALGLWPQRFCLGNLPAVMTAMCSGTVSQRQVLSTVTCSARRRLVLKQDWSEWALVPCQRKGVDGYIASALRGTNGKFIRSTSIRGPVQSLQTFAGYPNSAWKAVVSGALFRHYIVITQLFHRRRLHRGSTPKLREHSMETKSVQPWMSHDSSWNAHEPRLFFWVGADDSNTHSRHADHGQRRKGPGPGCDLSLEPSVAAYATGQGSCGVA